MAGLGRSWQVWLARQVYEARFACSGYRAMPTLEKIGGCSGNPWGNYHGTVYSTRPPPENRQGARSVSCPFSLGKSVKDSIRLHHDPPSGRRFPPLGGVDRHLVGLRLTVFSHAFGIYASAPAMSSVSRDSRRPVDHDLELGNDRFISALLPGPQL